MSNAPAGWYEDPEAPGAPRYWNGVAWLARGERPAAASNETAQHSGLFTPAAIDQPTAEFRPTPADSYADPSMTAGPRVGGQTGGNEGADVKQDVPWNVVGVERKPAATPTDSTAPPPWDPAAVQGFGNTGYGRTAQGQAWAPAPYVPPLAARGRFLGRNKIVVTIAAVALGIAVRWAFGLFFGADYSDDGRIDVVAPDNWTTMSVNSPDITYAMDDGWPNLTSSFGSQLSQTGMRVVDVRTLSTDFSGTQAIVVLVVSSDPVPGKEPSRELFDEAFGTTLDNMDSGDMKVVSREPVKVLKSRAGDRWGFSETTVSVVGTTITIYDAVSVVDDYIVEVELIVPEGVELTRNDLLAVANSIATR